MGKSIDDIWRQMQAQRAAEQQARQVGVYLLPPKPMLDVVTTKTHTKITIKCDFAK